MKNFIFRHQEINTGNSSAVENFYLNHSTDDHGLFKLQMLIDSKWNNFRTDREISDSTAFIGVILSGNQLRGETIVHPGDVIIERSRTQQLASRAVGELHRLVLIITRTTAFDLFIQTLFPENQTIIRNGNTGEIRKISSALEAEAAGNGDEKKISTLIFQLLQELNAGNRNKKYPAPVAKALEFIQKQGYNSILRKDIARNAGVSERQLNDLFQTFLHTTPAQYLIERRINFASELLSSGKFTVTEIARMSGFSSTEFFIRVFRKHTGITPGKYKSGKK